LPLKGTGNQSVLRLDGIELASHTLGFIAGPFDALLPLALNRLALVFQIASHQQACLQCRWLQGFVQQPQHQGVKWRGLQRLAHRFSVTIGHAAADMAWIGAVVVRTVGKVMVYLVEHDIRMPVRSTSSIICVMLRRPIASNSTKHCSSSSGSLSNSSADISS
jgi:hypothetical protein